MQVSIVNGEKDFFFQKCLKMNLNIPLKNLVSLFFNNPVAYYSLVPDEKFEEKQDSLNISSFPYFEIFLVFLIHHQEY